MNIHDERTDTKNKGEENDNARHAFGLQSSTQCQLTSLVSVGDNVNSHGGQTSPMAP